MVNDIPFLQLRDLRASYGKIEALHGVTVTINKGEIVSLLGANGAGKSTTLMCASGIIPITSGEVIFQGEGIQKIAAHDRVALGLAQVPEGRRIFPKITVHDNLKLGGYLQNDPIEKKRTEEYIYSLFPVLRERAHQLGGTLSGGEQQMLAIGRALMSKPSMLLLDEPSMGIAPLLVQKIFETLVELNRSGMTILLIEQNAHLALKISSRAYVMETGTITLQGPSSELASDPRVREAYLGG
jgi:branched-chain amino acid transport system ATP-binding protein